MEELEKERVRGASWYLEKVLELLQKSPDPLADAERLRGVRRGMAVLDFLYLVLREASARGLDLGATTAALRAYADEAKRGLDVVIANVECPRTAATISFSRAVHRFVQIHAGCIKRLYLAESRPGVEGAVAYAEYSRLVEVVPIPDSAVAAVDYDAAVAGLDGLYLDYAVNKVGTLPLFASAKARGASTIVVFESYKAVPLNAPEPSAVEAEVFGRRVEVPLFDKVPHAFVDLFVTDLGAFREARPVEVFNKALLNIFKLVDNIRALQRGKELGV
ncbi:MAG: translation initiation factor eIF-2B [Pyrobaculum sp.]